MEKTVDKINKEKVMCAKCNKIVDWIKQYSTIGPFYWWGVGCHGEYGVLRTSSILNESKFEIGEAFDEENKHFEKCIEPEGSMSFYNQRQHYQKALELIIGLITNIFLSGKQISYQDTISMVKKIAEMGIAENLSFHTLENFGKLLGMKEIKHERIYHDGKWTNRLIEEKKEENVKV